MAMMVISNHGLVQIEPTLHGQDVADAYGELIAAQTAEVTTLLDDLTASTKRVHDNRELTQRGKDAKVAELGRKALEKLANLTASRRRKLDQDLKLALAEIPNGLPAQPATDDAERMRRNLRYGEIRQLLMAEPEVLNRRATIQEAAETGDVELLRAIQDAPRLVFEKITDRETFEEAKARWLERNQPAVHERISRTKTAVQVYQMNANTAAQVIEKVTKVKAERPVEFLA